MSLEIKWKPVVHTRDDGSTWEEDLTFGGKISGLQILKDILEAPKVGEPMSLADASRYFVNMMWSDNTPGRRLGGRLLAKIFNEIGSFPKCLQHPSFGRHIVLKGDEYAVVEVGPKQTRQPPVGPVNVTWMQTEETFLEPVIKGAEGLRMLAQLTLMPAQGKEVPFQEALALWHQVKERMLGESGGKEKLAALERATGGFPMVLSRFGYRVVASTRDFFVTLDEDKVA